MENVMGFTNVVSGTCWKCTELEYGPDHAQKGKKVTGAFELTRAIVTRSTPGGTGIVDVRDAFRCKKCGELVPLDSWRNYQSNGDIVIRKLRNGHDERRK